MLKSIDELGISLKVFLARRTYTMYMYDCISVRGWYMLWFMFKFIINQCIEYFQRRYIRCFVSITISFKRFGLLTGDESHFIICRLNDQKNNNNNNIKFNCLWFGHAAGIYCIRINFIWRDVQNSIHLLLYMFLHRNHSNG